MSWREPSGRCCHTNLRNRQPSELHELVNGEGSRAHELLVQRGGSLCAKRLLHLSNCPLDETPQLLRTLSAMPRKCQPKQLQRVLSRRPKLMNILTSQCHQKRNDE